MYPSKLINQAVAPAGSSTRSLGFKLVKTKDTNNSLWLQRLCPYIVDISVRLCFHLDMHQKPTTIYTSV